MKLTEKNIDNFIDFVIFFLILFIFFNIFKIEPFFVGNEDVKSSLEGGVGSQETYNSVDILKNLYDNYLKKDFNIIFPSGNRNAGGPHFFKYAYDKYLNGEFTDEQFINFHKIYCAVSGSPISPDRSDASNIVRIKKYNSEEFLEGRYYRCCTPCICDLMKHSIVKENGLIIGNINLHLILLKDPCKNENNIPEEAPEFKCKNNKLLNVVHLNDITTDYSDSTYIVIGVLYPDSYDNSNETLEDRVNVCKETNRFDSDDPKGGMGDIFIDISKSGLDTNESHIGHDYKDFR